MAPESPKPTPPTGGKSRVTTLEELVAPVCEAHGVELVQVEYGRQKGAGVIRVIIDRERPHGDALDGSGVSLEDCTMVSRDLSTTFDLHEELFGGPYRLEVSSPGLERPLVKLEDFRRFAGREAKVKTKTPIVGRRRFQGTLLGVEDGAVRLEQDGEPVSIPFEDIGKAHLVYRF